MIIKGYFDKKKEIVINQNSHIMLGFLKMMNGEMSVCKVTCTSSYVNITHYTKAMFLSF